MLATATATPDMLLLRLQRECVSINRIFVSALPNLLSGGTTATCLISEVDTLLSAAFDRQPFAMRM